MARVFASGSLPAPAARFVTFLTLCLVGALLYAAQEVLVPIALAILLAFLLAPLVSRLERLHLPRGLAVMLSVLLGISVVVALVWALESQLVSVVQQLPNYETQIREKIDHFRHSGGTVGKVTQSIQETVKAVTPPTTLPTTNPAQPGQPPPQQAAASPSAGPAQAAGQAVGKTPNPGAPTLPNVTAQNPLPVRDYAEGGPSLAGSITTYLGKTLHPLATAFLVTVFVIFMLLGRDDLRDRVIRLAGGSGNLDLTTNVLDDAASRVSRYLIAQSIVNGTYAVLVAVGLWLIGKIFGRDNGGFPSVVLFGLLCGVFRFVPYVGPWLGATLPLAIAFGFFHGNAAFFTTLGMFVALEATVSQVAEPLVYGSSTGLSSLAVLVAAAFWAWLWGPIGLLLSTPLTVLLVVMGRYVPALRFLTILLGDEPALSPHARLYQRLAALDREQASDVAEEYLKEKGLEATYDDMLLPALALAERNFRRGSLNRRRYAFVRAGVRDLADELATTAVEADKKDAGEVNVVQSPPTARDGKVLCITANGQSDEIAGRMLSHLLHQRGLSDASILARRSLSDPVDPAAVRDAAAVCVSALPPAAAAHARALCRRLRDAVPPTKLIIGLWTTARDADSAARKRVACDPAVAMTTTLADTVRELQQRLMRT